MEKYLKVFKALSDDSRLRIVKMLEVKSMCVCEITSIIGYATATISNHLKILKEAGLVVQERSEKYINYSLNREDKAFIKEALEFVERLKDKTFNADKHTAIGTNRTNIC
ncbi:MAG: metalloregulator ArsR/SmtB family transcription factor [Candidatus Delongbacteria bacterium]|jgi:ArsR family transcriptional regulator|nr:metalloregulator ArsR/SmtB family transcription factor [Candidatus Delongbacteria bacterium]